MFVVVEQVCEFCGEVNDHLTTQCQRLMAWAVAHAEYIVWLTSQMR